MKKFVLLIAGLLVSISAFATCEEMVPWGFPTVPSTETTRLCRIAYMVQYDNARKVPFYSAEYLLPENIPSTNKRVNAFKPDPDLPPAISAKMSDYASASDTYDRGHMTPFEDLRKDSAAALQSFYLSNMIPHNLYLNRGLWHAIENKTRFWAATYQGVYVTTGPAFQPGYGYIGDGVGNPQYVFKVIIDKKSRQAVAFLVPNTRPVKGTRPIQVMVPVSVVSQMTGYDFTPNLPKEERGFLSVIGEQFK